MNQRDTKMYQHKVSPNYYYLNGMYLNGMYVHVFTMYTHIYTFTRAETVRTAQS